MLIVARHLTGTRPHGMADDGVVELVCLVGYFITVSLVMNAARTPWGTGVAPLEPFPS